MVQRALEGGHHEIISYLVTKHNLNKPTESEYREGQSLAFSNDKRSSSYVTWQEKTGLSGQSMTSNSSAGDGKILSFNNKISNLHSTLQSPMLG